MAGFPAKAKRRVIRFKAMERMEARVSVPLSERLLFRQAIAMVQHTEGMEFEYPASKKRRSYSELLREERTLMTKNLDSSNFGAIEYVSSGLIGVLRGKKRRFRIYHNENISHASWTV